MKHPSTESPTGGAALEATGVPRSKADPRSLVTGKGSTEVATDVPLSVEEQDGVLLVTLHGRPDGTPFVLGEAAIARLESFVRDELPLASAALIVSDHERVFCAGADVDRIASLGSPAEASALVARGQALFTALAQSTAKTVALIHGTCVGGGLELALACDARVATDAAVTVLGLPEVKLGILPAWGGCTRLPPLVGLQQAITLITTGSTVPAEKARRIGLVDSVVPREHLRREAAVLLAKLAKGPLSRTRKSSIGNTLLERTPPGRALLGKLAKKAILKQTHGHYPAPLAALDVVMASASSDVDASLLRERDAVTHLLASPVHKNLLHLFQITQKGRRHPVYRTAAVTPETTEVVVIGAGVMGAGIASVLVSAGFGVRLIDPSAEALTAAQKRIKKRLTGAVTRRKLSRFDAARYFARFTASTELRGLRHADVILEAAPERLDLKIDILKRAALEARADALFATNTSSFPLAELAGAVPDASRLFGLHFFNPPEKMPLLEIVRGSASSEAAIARGVGIAYGLGKTPIVVGDGPGFLVNRLLAPYFHDACCLANEGLPIDAIDRALLDFGMPMGPFRLMDEIGLDVIHHACTQGATREGWNFPLHPLVAALVESNALGKKTGTGFYDHRKKSLTLSAPLRALVKGKGSEASARAPVTPVHDRLIGRMIAEARKVIGEGLVLTPDDVDVGTVFGIGFPAFRGGLLRFAGHGEDA